MYRVCVSSVPHQPGRENSEFDILSFSLRRDARPNCSNASTVCAMALFWFPGSRHRHQMATQNTFRG